MQETMTNTGYYMRRLVALGVLVVSLLMVSAAPPAHASTTFTVNLSDDRADANPGDGTCSVVNFGAFCTLRAAIQEANATAGADTLNFDIGTAGTDVATITPAEPLPNITGPVTIDGYTQPGASPNTATRGTNARILVELDGSGISGFSSGLTFSAPDNVVRGLAINRFSGSGIVLLSPASNSSIEGNFLGTDPTGTVDLGNAFSGVFDINSGNNTVGGTSPSARNLISGNGGDGVSLDNTNSGNKVLGNLIGTKRDGKSPMGNGRNGVTISVTSGAAVGNGTREGSNTIAFNKADGVLIGALTAGDKALSNSIFSNGKLGIDLDGDGASANDPRDADSGANNLQNKPVLTSAVTIGRRTTIKGKLNSNPGSFYTIQLFSNPRGDVEGRRLIGEKTVGTDFDGNASFRLRVRRVGGAITATATKNFTGDTSEFSAKRVVRVR